MTAKSHVPTFELTKKPRAPKGRAASFSSIRRGGYSAANA